MALTPVEIQTYWVRQAMEASLLRTERHARAGTSARYGASDDPDVAFRLALVGCLGEVAVRQALGPEFPWVMDARDFHSIEGDVGAVQVRATVQARGRLILHPADDGNKVFYFVRLHRPDVEKLKHGPRLVLCQIVGSILGRDGMRPEFWIDPTGAGRWAYFVPDAALTPYVETVAA